MRDGRRYPVGRVDAWVGCLAVLGILGPVDGQVVVSEVMFDPSGSELYDEFIEIQNVGDKAVDLSGWRVGDGEDIDEILPRDGGRVLRPGAFGLVLDSGYFKHSKTYDPLPEEALILTVEDATLGREGLSNSRPEQVLLISASGDTVAAMTYRVGNLPGHSEEKVDPEGGDAPENWSDARFEGGTPGRVNSVSRKADDLALAVSSDTPVFLRAGAQGEVDLKVTNRGLKVAPEFRVEVFREGLPEVWEKAGGELAPGDSAGVTYPVEGVEPGRHFYRARLITAADQDSSNNRVSWEVVAGAMAGQAAINEVMFAPRKGGSEWIELLNRSEQVLDLSGWQVQDSRPGAADVFSKGSLKVPPGGYVVIVEDVEAFRGRYPGVLSPVVAPAGWPRLNDGGDAVVAKDATGAVVDSVVYGRQEGSAPGRSLERIDPAGGSTDAQNWLLSTEGTGATPGRANSVSVQGDTVRVVLMALPNPFVDRVKISS